MFITTKVFDPELANKAVFVSGVDVIGKMWDGFYLVGVVDGQYIQLVNSKGKDYKVHMDRFEHEDGLNLQILELPQPIKTPEIPNKVVVMETLPKIKFIKPPHKTGFTRKQGAKNFRSDLQIKVDNNHLEYMLQENVEPLKLEEIIKRMQANHGHWHWNEKNGCGFVKFAMKRGKCIKKFGTGLYGYDWEAAE